MSKVLELDSKNAKKFFTERESYINFDLPPYFVFDKTLSDITKNINQQILPKTDLIRAKENETVNHILYGNKDGRYSWRKYEIINPLLYVSLVNILTDNNNWEYLKNRFSEFQNNPKIVCESIPVLPTDKKTQQAAQISWWVNNVERKSIAYSLNFQYLFHTDIADCYDSVYTHSIPWAIHTKIDSKDHRGYNELFSNQVDHHIQAMSYGQTNGIPQGSILMDFIAEIILGYADYKLSKRLNTDLNGIDYQILRYRDDYRIFVKNTSDGDSILKCLNEVLADLGFKLNTHKTYVCDDVVSGSVKKDKIKVLEYGEVPDTLSRTELFRQLLIIKTISKKYPNSGSLVKRLSKILDAIKSDDFGYQQEVTTSMLIDIAYNNPKTFPVAAGLISMGIKELSFDKKEGLLKSIQSKICQLSNTGLLEVWLQRMAIKLNINLSFNEKLCLVANGQSQDLFETNWIVDPDIKQIIQSGNYFSQAIADKIDVVIDKNEVQLFKQYEE